MSTLNLHQTPLEIEESQLPDSSLAIGRLPHEETRRAIEIARGEFAAGEDAVHFGLGVRSRLEIAALNPQNDGTSQGVGNDESGSPVRFPQFPWSYVSGGEEVALAYGLSGTVAAGAAGSVPIGGTGASMQFGLETGTAVEATYVKLHPFDREFGPAVREDLGRFQLALHPGTVTGLEPEREYVAAEFQAGVMFKVGLSWGELFAANAGLLRSISPDMEVLKLRGKARAFVDVRVGLKSRLQLIASRRDSRTARVEFRKAGAGASGLDAGAEITAAIENPEAVDSALDELLAVAMDFRPEQLLSLRSLLAGIKSRFGVDAIEDVHLKSLAYSVMEKLGLDSNGLLETFEEGTWLSGVFEDLIDEKGLTTDAVEEFYEALERINHSVSLEQLPEEVQGIARIALLRLNLNESDFPLLSAALTRVGFRESLLSDAGNPSPALVEKLRSGIRDLIGGIDFGDEIVTIRNVAELIREETTLTAGEIFQRYQQERLLKRLSGGPRLFEELDRALGGAADLLDIIAGEDASLAEIASQLGERFHVPVIGLDVKLRELASRIRMAAREEVGLSVNLEFNRIRTDEALFAFDFLGLESHPQLFEEIYRRLLQGDFQFAIDEYRREPSLFENTEFFQAEAIEERRSFQVRILFKQNRQLIRKRSTIRNIEGATEMSMSESSVLGGGRGKRDWKTYFIINAQTDRFVSHPSADDFQFKFETGLFFAGRIMRNGLAQNNNRSAMEFMGDMVADSSKSGYTREEVGRMLGEAFEASRDLREFPRVRVDLKMEDGAMRWLWGSEKNSAALTENFRRSWALSRERGVFVKRSAPAPTEDSFTALFRLLALGIDQSPDHLSRALVEWTRFYRHAVRQTNGVDFPFKFCFLHALILTLRGDLPGWSLTGSLKLGDNEWLIG